MPGEHYRELAHWLRGIAAKCRLPNPQRELLSLARRYEIRANHHARRPPSDDFGEPPELGVLGHTRFVGFPDVARDTEMNRKTTVREDVFRQLSQGETDLNALIRQARVQFRSSHHRVGLNYVRRLRNEWQRASAARTES